MLVTIYLDFIIGMNLVFNGMILYLTSYLLRSNVTKWSLCIGTLLATALVPLQLYFSAFLFHHIVGKLLFSIFIVFVVFGWKGMMFFLKSISTFYFTSFTIGGGMLGVHYLFQDLFSLTHHPLLLTTKNMHGQDIHLLFVVIMFPLLWFFTKRRMDEHVTTKIKYDQLYDMTLSILGQSISTTGYLDSGNHLIDPITKRPVVLCDATYLQLFFDEKEWSGLLKSVEKNDVTSIPQTLQHKICIVPFQGVGGETSYLYTIKPDSISILYEGKQIKTTNVLVGIQVRPLTEEQNYHCLLHPKLVHMSTEISA